MTPISHDSIFPFPGDIQCTVAEREHNSSLPYHSCCCLYSPPPLLLLTTRVADLVAHQHSLSLDALLVHQSIMSTHNAQTGGEDAKADDAAVQGFLDGAGLQSSQLDGSSLAALKDLLNTDIAPAEGEEEAGDSKKQAVATTATTANENQDPLSAAAARCCCSFPERSSCSYER